MKLNTKTLGWVYNRSRKSLLLVRCLFVGGALFETNKTGRERQTIAVVRSYRAVRMLSISVRIL